MTFKASRAVLAAVAISAAFAGRASAVDPRTTGDYDSGFSTSPVLSFPTTTTTIPAGRDRATIPGTTLPTLQQTQRIALPDTTIGTTTAPGVRIAPISSTNPLAPPRQNRWRLGVYSKDTETGVRIVQVVNGSAAARAGLEAEDIIVSVSGYQVGYVNGQLYDCATEFERWATQDGWVRLLVQNNRNGRLVNMPVQLESRLAAISGSISLNDRLALPADAYAVVELQELVRTGAPPITLARQTIDRPRQYPIPFSIEFDPQQVDTRRIYVVTGSIQSNRQTIYAPRTSMQVLTPTQPSTVNLAFERVALNPGQPIGPYGQDVTLEQVAELFRQYLERDPSRQELAAWESNLQRGYHLADVRTDLLGQNQFFNQCDRDEQVYIQRLHQLMLGRNANPEEMAYWLDRYHQNNGVRRDVAREFLNAVGQID